MTATDRLLPTRIQETLATARFGRRIYYYPETGSTNDVALELARGGDPEGTIVVAEQQRAGRGHHDHRWDSCAGRDLLFSLVLRPRTDPVGLLPVTLALSTGMSIVLSRETGARVGVKWPNDLVCDRGKIAGILAEATHRRGRTDTLVLGVGVNVNSTAADLARVDRAISCRVLSGREHDRAMLLANLLATLETWYDRFTRDGFASLTSTYNDRMLLRGRRVTFLWKGIPSQGTVLAVADDGALAVALEGDETILLRNETIEEIT